MEIKKAIKRMFSKFRQCDCGDHDYTLLGGVVSSGTSDALVQKRWSRCNECNGISLRTHVYEGVIKSFQFKTGVPGMVHIEFEDERTENTYSIHSMIKQLVSGQWLLTVGVLSRSLNFASHRYVSLNHELAKKSSDDISKTVEKAERQLRMITSGLRVETALQDGNIVLSMLFRLYGYDKARYYFKWEKNKNKDLIVIEKRKKGRTSCK